MKKIITRPTDPLRNTCAWCGAFVATDSPVIQISVRAKNAGQIDKSLMQREEGRFVWLIPKTYAKPLPACVPTNDSPARSMGLDFIMMCCSETCASETRAALHPGFDVHAILQHSVIGFGGAGNLDSSGN